MAKAGRNERRRTKTADAGPARGSDLAVAFQSVYAPVCAGMEAARPGAQAAGEDRVLRRRLCHLLQRQCRGGADRDAMDDGTAEAHDQRGEDACASSAGRTVRLPGLQLRSVLLADNGPALYWDSTVEEESLAGHQKDPRLHRIEDDVAGADTVVSQINRLIAGWANYFSLGPVSDAYRAIDQYTWYRLRRWLCAKHKVGSTAQPVGPASTFTKCSGWNGSSRACITFRGRRPDVLSESRMR